MVVFDATIMLLLFSPKSGNPTDSNGKPIAYAQERVDGLVAQLAKAKTKIVVPTPALSEALVRAGGDAGAAYVAKLRKSAHFVIEPFDDRAALEVAHMTRVAKDNGNKKDGSDATWAKVKYDRQIVAIAKVVGATALYSDDKNLRAFAFKQGMRVISIAELPVPSASAQMDMLEEIDDVPNASTEVAS